MQHPNRLTEISTWVRGCAALAVAMAAFSCSDSTGPGSGPPSATSSNSPGTGTASLWIQGNIVFNDNPGVVGGFVPSYSVTVEDGRGNPVSGATVTIQNPTLGTLTLLETPGNPGNYWLGGGSLPPGDFRLDVVRGADNVRNAVIGGLGAHAILSPRQHDTLTAGDSLLVQWTVPVRAQSADVATRNTDPWFATADDGSFWLPAANNPANNNQRLYLYRYNEVSISGGLSGSMMTVTVRQSVDPYVLQ